MRRRAELDPEGTGCRGAAVERWIVTQRYACFRWLITGAGFQRLAGKGWLPAAGWKRMASSGWLEATDWRSLTGDSVL
jgi:hypothetical protein